MDKFKYIILSFLISTSAIAQDNQPPQIDLPNQSSDELDDPLLSGGDDLDADKAKEEAAPAVAAPAMPAADQLLNSQPAPQDKKILDKAIKEVFDEPAKEPAKPAETKKEETKPTDDVSVTVTGESSDTPAVVDESAEEPVVEAPKAEPTPAIENTVEKKEEVKTAEPAKEPAKAEEKKEEGPKDEEKAQVAPEKFVEEPKVAPAKTENVKLPEQSPKSVRESYEPTFTKDKEAAPVSATPVEKKSKPAAKKASSSSLPANVYLLNDATPNVQKVNVPVKAVTPVRETVPVATKKKKDGKKQLPKSMQNSSTVTTPVQETSTTPVAPVSSKQLPDSLKQGSLEGDDLDLITHIPSKNKTVDIKEDIVIDKGEFNNPFGDSTDSTDGKSDQALAEVPANDANGKKKDDANGVPVVDFSDTSAPDIDTTKPTDSTKADNQYDSFYMQDTGLEVEVKDAPKNSLGAMKNAYDALQVGQYESAINYYNDALEVTPNNKKALFGLATAYHMNKQYDQAREVYLKLIQLDPDFWPAVNNYIIMVTEENPEKSTERLEDLYSRNPTFAAIPAQLGNLYFRKGNLQKSAEYYTNAVKLEPRNIEYRYNLALILEKGGNYNDAAIIYQTLLEDAAKGAQLPEDPTAIRDRLDELLSKK